MEQRTGGLIYLLDGRKGGDGWQFPLGHGVRG